MGTRAGRRTCLDRHRPLAIVGGALLVAAAAPACNVIFGLDDLVAEDQAAGSSSGASSASTGVGGACGTTCPAPEGACFEATCDDGVCGSAPKSAGLPCAEGMGKVCDGEGACVECVSSADCGDGGCDEGVCVPVDCDNGVTDGSESDTDCGGLCDPCSPGKACTEGPDCLSGVCTGATCQDPTCVDGVKNGPETDIDCGASCPACGSGLDCVLDADCLSGICSMDACAAPSCSDGVENGSETDVDCGGSCPGCILGEKCVGGPDCDSGLCDTGVCALLNGCAPATAVDLTAEVDVTITFGSQTYSPPCFTVTAGTSVTFDGNFTGHDLYGGEIVGAQKIPDPASPFMPPTTAGTSKTFILSTPGDFGFYCEPHAVNGMKGAAFVVP